ncbi:MAG: nickel pincer cofactor biosynthesis protein LarC [Polyangiaceae bacterium]
MPISVVEDAVGCLGIAGYRLVVTHGHCGAIGATHFDVQVDSEQPHRSFGDISTLISRSSLAPSIQAIAQRIFLRLAEAEAKVHQVPVERVHFHEVGAVDSIVDIVGAAACFDFVGADLLVSPLPLGRGFIQCAHGRIPLPAPATVNCLVGLATYDGGLAQELVTPTAAAIFGALARGGSGWPALTPVAVGWGAGTRTLPDRPNALRVVLGDRDSRSNANEGVQCVLEANLDDCTGELTGHCIQVLLDAGALDAWATPTTMKKGRPGILLAVLAELTDADRLSALLLRETTSIGVRRHVVERMVRPRRVVDVSTRYGVVPVKVSEGPFGTPQIKPEFDACVAAARAHDVPVREVINEVLTEGRRNLG